MKRQLPHALVDSLRETPGFDKEAFIEVHEKAVAPVSIRLNPNKPVSSFTAFPGPLQKVPWSSTGFYLSSRPSFTFDPLFHAGCYYVQEASSMFLEQALKQLADLSVPLKLLDLCAAPGGKSTHLHSLISKESLLVSNEVVRGRGHVLRDNIIKWGTENVIVTHSDPVQFSALENYFDVIVVDAPCSGSGLLRKDPSAADEWSEQNVQLCSRRQQRIISDIWPALKQNGILIYATCSYSPEENEYIGKWILNNLEALHCPLHTEPGWGIIEAGVGYRCWPYSVEGEGFFLACFRKKDGDEHQSGRNRIKIDHSNNRETGILQNWLKEKRFFFKHESLAYAWPEQQAADLGYLLDKLRVSYSGVYMGELIREKLVPAHALAMSPLTSGEVTRTELDAPASIRYLQRKDLQFPVAQKGWQLVTFNDQPLGWINVLSNRINNYYPVELRILKDN